MKYNEVQLDYGVQGDVVTCTIESKPGYELYFSGSTEDSQSYFTVYFTKRIGNAVSDKMVYNDIIETVENLSRLMLGFQDKTIVLENGGTCRTEKNG